MIKWIKRLFYKAKNTVYEPPTPERPTVPPLETPIATIPTETLNKFANLITNEEGLLLCMESEGYHKKLINGGCEAYLCPANVWTIGYGTIKYPNGTKVKKGDRITHSDAVYFFKHEMDEKENVLDKFLKDNNVSLNSNEFSALVSFAYNLGIGVCINKSYSMCRAILSGDRQRIAEAFMLYTKAKNKWGIRVELRGLVLRRRRERSLFLKNSMERSSV